MKRIVLLLTTVCLLLSTRSVFAQTIGNPPFIKEVKGDTLVINDYAEMGGVPNSLFEALVGDTMNVPPGRVYELEAGGFYPLSDNPTTSAFHTTVITGSDSRMVVTNKDTDSAPPLITGDVGLYSSNAGGFVAKGDLTIKNCALVPAANDGTMGWAFATTNAPNVKLTFDNCLMERVRSQFVMIDNPGCRVAFKNCYFVNMNGQPCRRQGGVFECFYDLDTLFVENCTHINAQGSLYRFNLLNMNDRIGRTIVNHNTFINCAGYAFMNPGYQSKVSLTSNIFINCNIQPYPAIHSIDIGEQDPDWLPMGFVNVYPDSEDVANKTPRKFLVLDNLAYWDPFLSDMIPILNTEGLNGIRTWQSQMIIANARTDSMFHQIGRFNTTPYQYLQMDMWKHSLPTFVDAKNLFNTAMGGPLQELKAFALIAVDTSAGGSLPVLNDWRLVNVSPDRFVYPDWPIPVDLSYSDSELKTGGIGGFPLGDLNWFPTQKAAWLTAREAEYANIDATMNRMWIIRGVSGEGVRSVAYGLSQNFPNPFNPSTTITFSLPHSAHASLKVFDILGREVATLVNGYTTSGLHEVQFNATNLASGAYFYKLSSGNFTEVKEMAVVK